MKLADIIELAKQGYTPADIKELLNFNIEAPAETPTPTQGESVADIAESEQTAPQTKPTEEAPAVVADSIDYKKLYEESVAKLQEAQNNNINQAIRDTNRETDQEILNSLVVSFM